MRHRTAPGLTIGIAVLAFLTAGCNREQRSEAERTADTAAARTADAGREAGNDLQDGWITTKVQAKYFTTGEVKGRNIDVTTNNGVVTLAGTVENEQAKQAAIQIARDTDGVTRVEDRLTVGAPAMREQAHRDARDTPPTATAEREIAQPESGDGAIGTSGMTQRPNAWITTKIQAKYFADGTVKGRTIDVDTNNGIVTLTGHVENEAQRQQAVKLAQETEGVRRVDDYLRLMLRDTDAAGSGSVPVGETTHDTPGASNEDERTSDAGITARVQSKFFVDDVVKARNINVDTRQGIVTLEGEVQSESEHQQALSIARSVSGVRDVQDQLRVAAPAAPATGMTSSTTRPVEDAWVTTKIQSKFFLDDLVKVGRVDVTTQGGVVTLSGQVRSSEASQRAETLARETEGVTRVQNQLKVEPDSASGPSPVTQPTP